MDKLDDTLKEAIRLLLETYPIQFSGDISMTFAGGGSHIKRNGEYVRVLDLQRAAVENARKVLHG